MSKIRALAIEDDPIHSEKLRMIMDILDYDLIDIIADPDQVVSIVAATNPDVLLMDIDLNSEVSGIDLVSKINELHDVPTIFLTSFQDTETFGRAKETLPAAYLTKPYQADELERSIELAVLTSRQDRRSASGTGRGHSRPHLFIKDGSTLAKVLYSEISLVEAYDKYCYIHTHSKKFMVKQRLKNIADQLPEELFVQVHRSYVVNEEAIDQLDLTQGRLSVAGKEIGIGKTYKQALLSRISTLG